jgi:hypothetical protein
MNDQPTFDRTMLIPIGVGVFSLIGICAILVAGRITALSGGVVDVPSATPFKYAMIGTEPVVLTATFEGLAGEPSTGTISPDFPTNPPGNTPILLATNTIAPVGTVPSLVNTIAPSRTPTSASTAPFGAGTFDNTDYRMLYNGNWDPQNGVSGAYQNTLQVSGAVGNSVFFRFIGQELRVFYQAAPSLGNISLNLDGNTYSTSQNNQNTLVVEWVLPSVVNGTHTVTITHASGGSINLDYIIIPEVPVTPSPTITNTPINQ